MLLPNVQHANQVIIRRHLVPHPAMDARLVSQVRVMRFSVLHVCLDITLRTHRRNARHALWAFILFIQTQALVFHALLELTVTLKDKFRVPLASSTTLLVL